MMIANRHFLVLSYLVLLYLTAAEKNLRRIQKKAGINITWLRQLSSFRRTMQK